MSAVARVSGRLPLTARYAARDAARHRTRTVPAVAAVAATVAGVVALGIANASDERQNEMTYTPQAQMGTGFVSWGPDLLPGEELPDAADTWAASRRSARAAAPDVEVTRCRAGRPYDPSGYTTTSIEPPGGEDTCCLRLRPDRRRDRHGRRPRPHGDDRDVVDRALAAGRAVVFTGSSTTETDAPSAARPGAEQRRGGRRDVARCAGAAGAWDPADSSPAPAGAILPTALADELGLAVATVGLRLTGDLDEASETRIRESVQGAVDGTYLYVERGYERPDEAVIVLLVLGALGGVLMLGGTLTATFLALSDARPDLATLSAVGAAPRARRRVAASYALVVGVVGAILGAGVGFIPGIAISRPLTAGSRRSGAAPDGPFLAIPWLLIAVIVVALPLLTAAVVGLTARSRLPLVARLD